MSCGCVKKVNEQLAAKGHAAQYSHGMRITDSLALDCARALEARRCPSGCSTR